MTRRLQEVVKLGEEGIREPGQAIVADRAALPVERNQNGAGSYGFDLAIGRNQIGVFAGFDRSRIVSGLFQGLRVRDAEELEARCRLHVGKGRNWNGARAHGGVDFARQHFLERISLRHGHGLNFDVQRLEHARSELGSGATRAVNGYLLTPQIFDPVDFRASHNLHRLVEKRSDVGDLLIQIRTQFAEAIEAVITQTLCKKRTGGRAAALEILVATTAVRNLIREGKTHQIPSAMQVGQREGMQTMDMALVDLANRGVITREEAQAKSMTPNLFGQAVQPGKVAGMGR